MTYDWHKLRTRPLARSFAERLDAADDDGDDEFERTSLDGRPLPRWRIGWPIGRRPREHVAHAQPQPAVHVGPERGLEHAEHLGHHHVGRRRASLGRAALGRSARRQAHLGRIAGGVALCLLAGILALLLNPDLSSALLSASAPTAAAVTAQVDGPLTTFSDWRVAYMAGDTRLYVVTTDGQSTLLGPPLVRALPGETDTTLNIAFGASAAASPDGHQVAYLTSDATLALLDLNTAPPTTHILQIPPDATALYWSPDSARLALITRSGAIVIVTVHGAIVSRLTTLLAGAGLAELGAATIVGWRDPSTLLIARRALGLDAATLEAISVASDTARRIAVVPLTGAVLPRFSLSPAGTQILAFSNPGMGGAQALVTLVDTTTGRLLELPTIDRTLDGPVIAAAWNPAKPMIIALTRVFDPAQPSNPSLQLWTLDVASGTAAPARSYGGGYGIPLAWVPDAGTVILASVTSARGLPGGSAQEAPVGFELRSWPVASRNRRASLHTIAGGSVRFLGFVRSA